MKSPWVTFYCEPPSSPPPPPTHSNPWGGQYCLANEKCNNQTSSSTMPWSLHFHISLWLEVLTPGFRSSGWVFLLTSMIFIINMYSRSLPSRFPSSVSYFRQPELSEILHWAVSMGDCCWQPGREEEKEKGNKEEASRRKGSWGKRELSKWFFWKQPMASCCLRSAFVFNVLNSITTLFIQFCEPDSALKVPNTCLNILPAKASITEMKPCYKKAQHGRGEFELWDREKY